MSLLAVFGSGVAGRRPNRVAYGFRDQIAHHRNVISKLARKAGRELRPPPSIESVKEPDPT